ncbi:MAG TPA: AAA family ATPase [Pyrinomonadaceae bacterium]
MPEETKSITEALAAYDREKHRAAVEEAEGLRKEVWELFPLDSWPEMPLERYALGQPDHRETFCRWMEFKTIPLGSIKGGNAGKHIIYKRKDRPGWSFPPQYRDEREAWEAVRAAFVEAFRKARAGEWDEIDAIEPLRWGSVLKVKSLHTYFPDGVLPVYGWNDLKHFLGLLGRPEATDRSYDLVRLNRTLLSALQEYPGFDGWSNVEIMRFLYDWSNPHEAPRVVKIAPGDEAKYWEDCLAGGYVCVGWDEVGDLREFESKEAFRARFEEEFGERPYNGNASMISRKANELWTLTELEPGDLVVANKGISKVLAVGEVLEPGYEWGEGHESYRHLVRVNWDTSYEQQIEPQKSWGVRTVADVPAALFKTIMSNRGGGGRTSGGEKEDIRIPVDALYGEMAGALERKGQLILYGPPGTGKTFAARRFAVWWLLRDGVSGAAEVFVDQERFSREERALSTVQAGRRVWFMVAQPKRWGWDRLFSEGRVEFGYGLLQRNYPLVRAGDLVVGYHSGPEMRIKAVAKVAKGFESRDGAEPTIELEPVAQIAAGLTFADLQADRVLSASEPMRFNVRGTLFALTAEEADHLFALLSDRDPSFRTPEEGTAAAGVGAITRLTFHPSYSYEDFIEGFRPVDTGGGGLVLRLEDGVFKRVCREAQANPKRKYLILVDEINRANLAKVFGETITLLEKDKRGMQVTLPQSKESFAVPPNVFILGTMNTADRSIKLLDAALRRRFAFIELMPEADLLQGASVGALMLDGFLEGLNRRVAKTEGREKQIGHSFLLEDGKPVADAEEFARRFRQEILPLLQEYCYEDYGALAGYLGGAIVDREANALNSECLNDPEALIRALAEEFGGGGNT